MKAGKVYGYIRVSTPTQNLERQRRNVTAYDSTAIIREEVYTGTRTQGRSEFNKLLRLIKGGDTLIFDSVSRMSRNAAEGFELYKQLFEKGVNLVFLRERHIDSATYQQALSTQIQVDFTTDDTATSGLVNDVIEALNRFTFALAEKQILLAFEQAQKEVDDLSQRTKEGLLTAKLNGKQIGGKRGTSLETKKSKEAKQVILKHSKTFGGTLSNSETWKLAEISKMTFYAYRKQLLQEQQEKKQHNLLLNT